MTSAKPVVGHQRHRRAPPFEQRVGGHGRAVGQHVGAASPRHELGHARAHRSAGIVGVRRHLRDAPVGGDHVGERPSGVATRSVPTPGSPRRPHASSPGSMTQTSSPRWSSSDRNRRPSPASSPSHTSTASSTLRASQASRRASAAPGLLLRLGRLLLQEHHVAGLVDQRRKRSRRRRGHTDPDRGRAAPRRSGTPSSTAASAPSISAPSRRPADHDQVGVHLGLGRQDLGQPRRALRRPRVVVVAPELGRPVAQHDQRVAASGRPPRSGVTAAADRGPAPPPVAARRASAARPAPPSTSSAGPRPRSGGSPRRSGLLGRRPPPPPAGRRGRSWGRRCGPSPSGTSTSPRSRHQLDERLPQVAVGDRLLLAVESIPAGASPPTTGRGSSSRRRSSR